MTTYRALPLPTGRYIVAPFHSTGSPILVQGAPLAVTDKCINGSMATYTWRGVEHPATIFTTARDANYIAHLYTMRGPITAEVA